MSAAKQKFTCPGHSVSHFSLCVDIFFRALRHRIRLSFSVLRMIFSTSHSQSWSHTEKFVNQTFFKKAGVRFMQLPPWTKGSLLPPQDCPEKRLYWTEQTPHQQRTFQWQLVFCLPVSHQNINCQFCKSRIKIGWVFLWVISELESLL